MDRDDLANYLDQLLQVPRFHDYCPNGLQVEGRAEIGRIVSGVTASLQLLEAAADAGADAVLVHHGYFWRAEDARLTGMKHRRVAALIRHDMNLFAYHLPLDAHPELGNNAQLARRLGFIEEGRFGEQDIGAYGSLPVPARLDALAGDIGARLARPPMVIGETSRLIRRIAWCTGAAQDYFEDAIRLGVDAFLSGEISEQTVHAARESGVAFISAGHHATERFGVQAVGGHLAEKFGLAHVFIDVDNPV